jgi:hypothetical protein
MRTSAAILFAVLLPSLAHAGGGIPMPWVMTDTERTEALTAALRAWHAAQPNGQAEIDAAQLRLHSWENPRLDRLGSVRKLVESRRREALERRDSLWRARRIAVMRHVVDRYAHMYARSGNAPALGVVTSHELDHLAHQVLSPHRCSAPR